MPVLLKGEVSEAFQFAAPKKLPIIYLVQDNDWGISVTAKEARVMDAYEYAGGFPGVRQGLASMVIILLESYNSMKRVINDVRVTRAPFIVQAKVPLLGHHTSGVRKRILPF